MALDESTQAANAVWPDALYMRKSEVCSHGVMVYSYTELGQLNVLCLIFFVIGLYYIQVVMPNPFTLET